MMVRVAGVLNHKPMIAKTELQVNRPAGENTSLAETERSG